MTRLQGAEPLPCGRIQIVLPVFGSRSTWAIMLAVWAMVNALHKDEVRFGAVVGLSLEQAWALKEEITFLCRCRLSNWGRRPDIREPALRSSDGLWPPLEPRRTGTAWDRLTRIEAYLLPGEERDGEEMAALILPHEKLLALAGSFDVALVRWAPGRSVAENEGFRLRFGSSTREAEEFRDELRRVERELRS